jgi:hypothetical protein
MRTAGTMTGTLIGLLRITRTWAVILTQAIAKEPRPRCPERDNFAGIAGGYPPPSGTPGNGWRKLWTGVRYRGRDPARLFACWTRKEAFVKALGDGIAFGLNEFSVSVNQFADTIALATHCDPEEAGNLSLLNIRTNPEYIAALAVTGQGLKVRYWGFDRVSQ